MNLLCLMSIVISCFAGNVPVLGKGQIEVKKIGEDKYNYVVEYKQLDCDSCVEVKGGYMSCKTPIVKRLVSRAKCYEFTKDKE